MQVSLLGLMCGLVFTILPWNWLTCFSFFYLGVDFLVSYDLLPRKTVFSAFLWGKILFCVPFNACAVWPPEHSN
jgi:hypothetical protein